MTALINPHTDKVLKTYTQYYDILMIRHGDSNKERNLDHIAATLTLSHFMDHIVCKLTDLKKTRTP